MFSGLNPGSTASVRLHNNAGFFLAIGPNNRRLLKHIKLEFKTVSQLISFPHELTHGRPGSFEGGKVVAEAVELLARSHSLGTVEIARVPAQVFALTNYPSFKLSDNRCELGVRLRLLKLVNRLVCKEVEEWALEPINSARRTQYDQYMIFKAEMES